MRNPNNSIGMTLMELILTLALSILIMNTIYEIYLIGENSRLAQSSLIKIQENELVINQIIKNTIQQSSYVGCAKLSEDFPFKNNLSLILNQKNKIEKYRDEESKEDTDGIRIWHASDHGAVIQAMHGYSALYVSENMTINIDDNLIISDCKTTETLQVKQIYQLDNGMLKIIPTKPLSKLYGSHAEINQLEVQSYFIGATRRFDQKGRIIYALFSKDINGNKRELAEGVSQMKILFYTVENNTLTAHDIKDLTNANDIVSLSFSFDLTGVTAAKTSKKWNLYVALS